MTRVRIGQFLVTNLAQASALPDEPCCSNFAVHAKAVQGGFSQESAFRAYDRGMGCDGGRGAKALQKRQKRCLRQWRHSACAEQC
jgi:hypothetical protein